MWRWLIGLVALWGVLVGCRVPDTAGPWPITISVFVPDSAALTRLEARAQWQGEALTADLAPTTTVAEGQRLWQGQLSSPPARVLQLSLWSSRHELGTLEPTYQALELLTVGEQSLSYAMDPARLQIIRRLPDTWTVSGTAVRERAWIAGSLLWGGLLVLGVGLLSRRVRGTPAAEGRPWPAWLTPVLWGVLAVAWTWPAVLAGGDRLIGRQFDALGTVWFIDAAPRLLQAQTDALTGWPDHADYAALDSYTLLLLSAVLQALDPVRLHGLLQVVGVAVSGWAASGFARAVGARAPWHLLGGMGFALSGLAANALLEGHIYHLLDPWLPLFAWAWWVAMSGAGRAMHGLLAGGLFALTLLTTGYLGLAAAIVAVCFFVGGLLRARQAVIAPALAALAVVVPVGLLLLARMDGAGTGHSVTLVALQLGSASLLNLAGPSPELDRTAHSMALCLPGVVLALVLSARRVLADTPRWPVLAATAAVALLLAAGPVLTASINLSIPSPVGWIWTLAGSEHLRFPVRLLWAGLLCASALAAWVASVLAARFPRWAPLLLIAALIDAFLIVGLPHRQQVRLASFPSAYRQVDGPILELLPEGLSANSETDSWLSAISCLSQIAHHRAIAEDCVEVPVTNNPGRVRSRWAAGRLLSGDDALLRHRLSAEGFAALSVQPDLLHPGDWRRIAPVLDRLDPDPLESHDGGAWVRLYRIPPGTGDALPQTQVPTTAIGAPEDARPALFTDLSLDLIVPEETLPARYLARLGTGSAVEFTPLSNDGSLTGDWPHDRVWSAQWSGVTRSHSQLQVISEHQGARRVLWEGSVWVTQSNDRLVLRMTSPEQARPFLAAVESASPAVDADTAPVAAAGWAGILLITAGLAVPRGARRRRRRRRW